MMKGSLQKAKSKGKNSQDQVWIGTSWLICIYILKKVIALLCFKWLKVIHQSVFYAEVKLVFKNKVIVKVFAKFEYKESTNLKTD